ncbi:ABC1-domain-containing protein [Armillaria luteobubalina]|uniref:ABC1-domain-containing protein n=1 Tax=Armillaria luteobubalina TaxID=153913 RepID=A0AA39UW22_9AGAR|nr:ABC1-domain-containing protein [Armillaria luteobubalina]
MPPGPAYNWLCVLSSAADILGHAARVRASQIAGQRSVLVARTRNRDAPAPAPEGNKIKIEENVRPLQGGRLIEPVALSRDSIPLEIAAAPDVEETPPTIEAIPNHREDPVVESISTYETVQPEEIQAPPTRNLSSSKVPSSRIGRLFHYGGLAASLSYGAASELLRRTDNSGGSVMMTEANIKRLVSKLSQMRGAALKLGPPPVDTHLLPPEVDKIFRRVQDSAHYMPDWQMEKVLQNSLGVDWASHFDSFDRIPFAAASIGQVHSAVLTASTSPTGKPYQVAVKVQFPNIANSIDSDLGYIKLLLTCGQTVSVMKQELADECDYTREASFLRTFGSAEYLGNDSRFKIPWVWEGSTDRVLVMERIDGISVGEANIKALSQSDRDTIAACVIELCLKELFEFRMMQTDPNWTNFLWDARTRRMGLVDFGATRSYSKEFMDGWLRLLQAAVSDDWDACVEWSLKVGYLTGQENQIMLDAHVKSMTLLAAPFKSSTPQPYTFGRNSGWADITAQIRDNIPVMLEHRLTPPPQETYSLNRKLSGAFLLASRLEATVDTKEIWDRLVDKYTFS